MRDKQSDECRERIVGAYPSKPSFKHTSNEFIIIFNCLSDKIMVPSGHELHKESIGILAVAIDVLGIMVMIYMVYKLEDINKDYIDIVDQNQITMKDFSVMCSKVHLDKYTQDPILIKMKVWLHFNHLMQEYKLEGNDQEIIDVTLSMCTSPAFDWIFQMEGT
jgi:hypothetical protein